MADPEIGEQTGADSSDRTSDAVGPNESFEEVLAGHVDEGDDVAGEEPSAVPVASVILWLPPTSERGRWTEWVVWGLVILTVPLMVLGMEAWMAAVSAVIAVVVAAVAVVTAIRRRRHVARCGPSQLSVGEGYLELRQGSGPAAQTHRWSLAEVRSVRFKSATFGAGGTVTIATTAGKLAVLTGPPAGATKNALKHARAAARVQGFELGSGGRRRGAEAARAGGGMAPSDSAPADGSGAVV